MRKSRRRFRKVHNCEEARFVRPPAYAVERKWRGSKRAGILFERKVGEKLDELYPNMVLHNCWVEYYDSIYGVRTCSPDHLIVDVEEGVVTIVECKLSHTRDAWEQINNVYKPVVEKLLPGFVVRGIEVCKHFTSGIPYPDICIVSDWDGVPHGCGNVMVGV